MLPSAEYYLLGLGHPIMQTYYNLLVNVATLLGGDKTRAKREMKELIEFEIELASVRTCSKFFSQRWWLKWSSSRLATDPKEPSSLSCFSS